MRDTWPLLEQIAFPPIRRGRLDTLQVNLGYRCNQSCVHCHVNAGPNRTEEMSSEVVDVVLAFLARKRVATLDITGGAPELNQHFRKLVRAARKMDVQVMDRCNLTVLEVPGQEDLAQFLACEEVEITASMPCYLEDNVNCQRGKGVFEGSLRGLQRLNKLGYGRAETGLVLNLVYNPEGPSLPPSQRRWKPITSACSVSVTASSSIGSIRLQTGPFSGSGRSLSPRASSTATSICFATLISTPISST